MKKQQLKTLKMSKRLEYFLDNVDSAILSTIPLLLIWFNDIKLRLEALAENIQAFDDIIKGYQKAKKIARINLIKATLDLTAQIQAYANSIDDVVLFERMAFTKTFLEKANSTNLRAVTKNILDNANENILNLIPFGVTQQTIDEFALIRTTFVNADPKPEEAKEEREASTVAIEQGLKAIMKLWMKIDNAMRGAAVTMPILAQDYFRARKVDRAPKRTNAVQGLVTNMLGVPMPYVTLTCTTLDLNRKITKKGRFIIKSGKHMQHILVFNYPGYKEVRRTVTITAGLRKNITIMMEEINAQ